MPRIPEWAWWLGGGVLALALFVATLPWTVQAILRILLRPFYRLEIRGRENLPRSGPALVAANHVSWLDGFILAAAAPRRGRALVFGPYVSLPVFRHLFRWIGLIPVPARGPKAVKAMMEAAGAALDRGELLGIFPEGQITRTGMPNPFQRGLEVILKGREHVPVVPVALDNLWGSLPSFSGRAFFRKRPERVPRPIGVVFGPPVPPPVTAFAVRQAVLELGVRAFELRPQPARPLETIDPALPHLEHPELGPLAASVPNYEENGFRQIGHKPDTVGQAVPGVALRVVDDAGTPLPPDAEGRLQALIAYRPDWIDTGFRARMDRDGFVTLA